MIDGVVLWLPVAVSGVVTVLTALMSSLSIKAKRWVDDPTVSTPTIDSISQRIDDLNARRPVAVAARPPRHPAPDGTGLCCDQAQVAWPHPCPWH